MEPQALTLPCIRTLRLASIASGDPFQVACFPGPYAGVVENYIKRFWGVYFITLIIYPLRVLNLKLHTS